MKREIRAHGFYNGKLTLLPCEHMDKDKVGWCCMADETGCIYNDGHNGCGNRAIRRDCGTTRQKGGNV